MSFRSRPKRAIPAIDDALEGHVAPKKRITHVAETECLDVRVDVGFQCVAGAVCKGKRSVLGKMICIDTH